MISKLPPEVINNILEFLPDESIVQFNFTFPEYDDLCFAKISGKNYKFVHRNFCEILIDAAIYKHKTDFYIGYALLYNAEQKYGISVIPHTQMADIMIILTACRNSCNCNSYSRRLVYRKPIRAFIDILKCVNSPSKFSWKRLRPYATDFGIFAASHLTYLHGADSESHITRYRNSERVDKYDFLRVLVLAGTDIPDFYRPDPPESENLSSQFIKIYGSLIDNPIYLASCKYISATDALMMIASNCSKTMCSSMMSIHKESERNDLNIVLYAWLRFFRKSDILVMLGETGNFMPGLYDIHSINAPDMQHIDPYLVMEQIAYFDDVKELSTWGVISVLQSDFREFLIMRIKEFNAWKCQRFIAAVIVGYPHHFPRGTSFHNILTRTEKHTTIVKAIEERNYSFLESTIFTDMAVLQ